MILWVVSCELWVILWVVSCELWFSVVSVYCELWAVSCEYCCELWVMIFCCQCLLWVVSCELWFSVVCVDCLLSAVNRESLVFKKQSASYFWHLASARLASKTYSSWFLRLKKVRFRYGTKHCQAPYRPSECYAITWVVESMWCCC